MRGIETLVYFDIEATGLKSSGRPRITEISFLAVKMDDTLNLSFEIMQLLLSLVLDYTSNNSPPLSNFISNEK